MSRFRSLLRITNVFSTAALMLSITAPQAFAQVNASDSATLPLVYSVENTGAAYPAPNFPSFSQLPIQRVLPDPFVFASGTRSTSFSDWERRRNEIAASIQKYEIGQKPDCHDCTITANYVPPAPGAADSARGTLTVVVTRNGKSLTLTSGVYLPKGLGNGPFAALIPMTFVAGTSGPNYGSLPATAFAGLPVATIDFVHNQTALYTFSTSSHANDPFYQLYPELCAGICNGVAGTSASNSGEYAAWSWGVSRLIDGIQIATRQANNALPIDPSHLAVTGCSYAGKMALFAGAFDERIAATIAQENGGGGAPAWRVSQEIEPDDKVENLTHTSQEWFAGQMWQFADNNVYKMPTDHHELMAMIAPRALLETGNTDYNWLSNRSNYITARATQKIFNTLGIGDRFGYYIDGNHAHCGTLPAEAPVITSFVNKFMLGSTTANTNIQVTPFPNLDADRWTSWWGSNNPVFPNDWDPGDGTVVSSTPSNLTLAFGDTLSAGYQLAMPTVHPDTTVTVNGAYNGARVEADIACSDGSSYTLTVPLPSQTFSIAAGNYGWNPLEGTPQGAVTNNAAYACSGIVNTCNFSALGQQPTRGAGNNSGPGFTSTDTQDPLNVRYRIASGTSTANWSGPITVFFRQGASGTIEVTGVVKLSKLSNGDYQATISLQDSGTAAASNAQLQTATLGTASAASLPQSVGSLNPGASLNVVVNFAGTAGASGTATVLKFTGNYDGGTFGGSVRVKLP